jgi:hypothetical protein
LKNWVFKGSKDPSNLAVCTFLLKFSLNSCKILTIFATKLVSEILKNFNKYAVNTNVFAKKVKEFREKNAKIDHNM